MPLSRVLDIRRNVFNEVKVCPLLSVVSCALKGSELREHGISNWRRTADIASAIFSKQ